MAPNDVDIFLPYYDAIKNKEHATGTFADPGQDRDTLYEFDDDGGAREVDRPRRPDAQRTRVWYGPIGSGEKLMKNAQKRNELRDRCNRETRNKCLPFVTIYPAGRQGADLVWGATKRNNARHDPQMSE